MILYLVSAAGFQQRLVARFHIIVLESAANVRYKLNVMCDVTECWSFKGNCTNFGLQKRFFNASSYIGAQLGVPVPHTLTHTYVCFSYQSHTHTLHLNQHILISMHTIIVIFTLVQLTITILLLPNQSICRLSIIIILSIQNTLVSLCCFVPVSHHLVLTPQKNVFVQN